MTTTTQKIPKTAADARKLIGEITAKRADLQAVVDSSVGRRKGHAVAAAFGDAAAKASLQNIEAEESSARGALQNLDLVISEMEQLCGELQTSEAEDLVRQREAELSEATDRLLAVDDELDDTLDRARDLLIKREEIACLSIFAGVPSRNFGVGGIEHTQEMGESLLAYFDRWMKWLPFAQNYSYRAIERVADWDARHLGRQSPGMLKRGPRAPTPIETSMRRTLSGPSWIKGDFGFDSSTKRPETRVLKPGEFPDIVDDEASMRLPYRKDQVRRSPSSGQGATRR